MHEWLTISSNKLSKPQINHEVKSTAYAILLFSNATDVSDTWPSSHLEILSHIRVRNYTTTCIFDVIFLNCFFLLFNCSLYLNFKEIVSKGRHKIPKFYYVFDGQFSDHWMVFSELDIFFVFTYNNEIYQCKRMYSDEMWLNFEFLLIEESAKICALVMMLIMHLTASSILLFTNFLRKTPEWKTPTRISAFLFVSKEIAFLTCLKH